MVIEIGGEARDARDGSAIDLTGTRVRMVMREIGGDDDQRLRATP